MQIGERVDQIEATLVKSVFGIEMDQVPNFSAEVVGINAELVTMGEKVDDLRKSVGK